MAAKIEKISKAAIKAEPKDVFMHLFTIIMLYASAINFLILIFQYVNVLIPDPLERMGFYDLSSSYQTMRWALATIIVVFPIYIASAWFLNKSYVKMPQKTALRIRKWLIYFTLFAAALIIIGDLVTLLFHFFGGELTIRFLLKILAVFFVAGSVFGYYVWELKRYKINE